jgi:CTP:molybdopterin cytidylyltransferase MocA
VSKIAALLLAAGWSRRMRAFKPLLPFGETTVIENCIHNLRAGGIETIIVVLGHRAEEVSARIIHLHVHFALNDNPHSEMVESIARGIRQTSSDAEAVIIALADQPAIPAEVISRLLREYARTKASLIVPEYKGRGGHPVLIDLKFREELLHLDMERGLRSLFDAHAAEVLRLSIDSPYVLRDIDSWQDYCALHEEVFGLAPPPFVPDE